MGSLSLSLNLSLNLCVIYIYIYIDIYTADFLSLKSMTFMWQESSDKRFEVKLPGTLIPECFNHCIGEGKLSFWVRQNLPDVALCLAFELDDEHKLEGSFYFSCDIWIQVNRLPILQLESYREFQTIHHLRLIHLHGQFIREFQTIHGQFWKC